MLGDPDTPLSVGREAIVGWRSWDVIDGSLVSPSKGAIWEGGALEWDGVCRCAASQVPSRARRLLARLGLAPAHCVCGINAYLDREQLTAAAYMSLPAVGVVELTGEVRTFERGYRGQKARACKMWATDLYFQDRVEAAARQAGVEYGGVIDQAFATPIVAYERWSRALMLTAALKIVSAGLLVVATAGYVLGQLTDARIIAVAALAFAVNVFANSGLDRVEHTTRAASMVAERDAQNLRAAGWLLVMWAVTITALAITRLA
jgi:hypothetical protein